jgi:hypothetical protein
MGNEQLKTSILMFDNPNGRRSTTMCERDGIITSYSIRLMNARPTFTTSDDCLVSIAQDSKSEPLSSLYVTSDRELAHRLLATGMYIISYHIISLMSIYLSIYMHRHFLIFISSLNRCESM